MASPIKRTGGLEGSQYPGSGDLGGHRQILLLASGPLLQHDVGLQAVVARHPGGQPYHSYVVNFCVTLK